MCSSSLGGNVLASKSPPSLRRRAPISRLTPRTRPRKPARSLEYLHCKRYMAWVRLCGKALEWLHHIPNGEDRHPAVGAKLKEMGVKSGVYDYFLPLPRGQWHGFYLEMKRDNEQRSDTQVQFAAAMEAAGYKCECAWSGDEAISLTQDYLKAGPFCSD